MNEFDALYYFRNSCFFKILFFQALIQIKIFKLFLVYLITIRNLPGLSIETIYHIQ